MIPANRTRFETKSLEDPSEKLDNHILRLVADRYWYRYQAVGLGREQKLVETCSFPGGS